MKLYLSVLYSSDTMRDVVYPALRNDLVAAGHQVTTDNINYTTGESFYNGVVQKIRHSDWMIAVISNGYTASAWCNAELNIAQQNEVPVLAVLVGKHVSAPSSLHAMQYIRVSDTDSIRAAVLNVVSKLSCAKSGDKQQVIAENTNKKTETANRGEQLRVLKKVLSSHRLTFICGAGVSVASGVPKWDNLLAGMLDHIFAGGEKKVTAEELLQTMKQSSNLITGKYLKLLLADDFEKSVKQQLYAGLKQGYLETPMLKAIAALARPKDFGIRLESIITFNFDDLIEKRLSRDGIAHRSVWTEGQAHNPKELPVYHVHGFLPNTDGDPISPHLVFSEESYHSQFIDPYSWSNLCLLNALSSNVCLFVGLSLSDPNLRRLLDISHGRNQKTRHYIVMKKTEGSTGTNKIVDMLFEQDANSLGLNVIWVDRFDEMPDIILDLAHHGRRREEN